MHYKALAYRTVLGFLAAVLFSLALHFPFFESLTFQRIEDFTLTCGSGIEALEENRYLIDTDSPDAYFEIADIGGSVRNISLSFAPEEGWPPGELAFHIEKRDGSTDVYELFPTVETVYEPGVRTVVRVHSYGNTKGLRVWIHDFAGILRLEEVALNVRAPFHARPGRFLFLSVCFILVALLLPGSPLYRIALFPLTHFHRLVTGAFLAACILYCIAFYPMAHRTDTLLPAPGEGDTYASQTESLLHGHLYLEDREVAPALLSMEDPYDRSARIALEETEGSFYEWDVAYYKGRYYSYFGVVPALLFYLPVRLLTGSMPQIALLVLTLCCLTCIAVFAFVYALAKKYFPGSSFGHALLLSLTFCSALQLTCLLRSPGTYELPIASGLFFAISGLSFWLEADSNNDFSLRKPHLLAGAVLIALTMGCRPQYAIAVLCAFVIFLPHIRRGLFFSRAGLSNTLLVICPFLAVGIPLLLFNALRFDNPFSFGWEYLFTVNDLYHASTPFEERLYVSWLYYFQPPAVFAEYPYLHEPYVPIPIQSNIYVASDFRCGLFCAAPVLSAAFYLLFMFLKQQKGARSDKTDSLKNELANHSANGRVLGLTALVFALLLGQLDVVAGVSARYLTDTAWLMMIPVCIAFGEIPEKKKEAHTAVTTLLLFLGSVTFLATHLTNVR